MTVSTKQANRVARIETARAAAVKASAKSGAVAAPGLDPYFRRPVWLSTPCCGEMLWAYNPAHLDFLAAFVGARIRERRRDPVHGWSNAAIASRLPAWLKAAKNRAAILEGVERLRRRVAEAIERA